MRQLPVGHKLSRKLPYELREVKNISLIFKKKWRKQLERVKESIVRQKKVFKISSLLAVTASPVHLLVFKLRLSFLGRFFYGFP